MTAISRARAGMMAASALALAMALGGCALLPKDIALDKPMTADQLHAARITGPAAAWPGEGWWNDYNDPTLAKLIDEALAKSPTLAEVKTRILTAKAQADYVGADLLPSVTANASVDEVKQSYYNGFPPEFIPLLPRRFHPDIRTTLDFNYEFDFWGSNRANLAAAISEYKAAEAEEAQARLALTTSVASAYADLVQIGEDYRSAEEAVKTRRETYELLQDRQKHGLENAGPVAQARGALASADASVAELKERRALAKNRLAALLGAGPDRGFDIEASAVQTLHSFGVPENLPANLIGRRPDVVAARLRAEAEANQIKRAHAAFYPNISLSGYAGQQSLGLNVFTKGGASVASFGPAVSLPIFVGGRLQAALTSTEAQYNAAVASYNGTLVQALEDVADAVTSIKALDERLADVEAAVSAAKVAHDVALRRYKGGLATYLEVLSTEDALIANQRALTDLKARGFALDIALIRALGGGYKA